MENKIEDFEITEWRKRMRFMADIVFATAMTIMILNLEFPEMKQITDIDELTKFMLKQLAGMGTFFIAFVTVAVYWMKHLEHFGITLKVNQTYIWYQLLYLAFIMLIPFWSTYVGEAPENIALKVFLSLNMVLIGGFSYLSMHYAANPKHRLIHEAVPDKDISETKKQILAEPAIAILAAGLALINPAYWDVAFVLIPVLFIARKQLVKVKYF
jgi:TMEM175 potassium channel family protein